MSASKIEYKGISYNFKYTLEKYCSSDPKGFLGEGKIIIEQNSLDGFLDEILKDTNACYRIIYPCTEGDSSFDHHTGRWAFEIGKFDYEIKDQKINRQISHEIDTIIGSFKRIKNLKTNTNNKKNDKF